MVRSLLILLSLLSALGFMASEPGIFLTVVVPYAVICVSYWAFIYCLRRVRYWKTLFHFGITLLLYTGILYITGNDPFAFQKETGAMVTFQNLTSEAVMGTVLGFYGGSFVLYLVAKGKIRERWPAIFHEEIADFIHQNRDLTGSH